MVTEPRIDRILIPEAEIDRRLEAMAAEIGRDTSSTQVLHCVAVLKGAFVFMADLGRAIHRAGGPKVEYHFLQARTYGRETKSANEKTRPVVTPNLDLEDLSGRDVLLLEDVLDQGFTLTALRQRLLTEIGARSVRICVLLEKQLDAPSPEVQALRRQLRADYVGFTIPDLWVVGYGLDAAGQLRNLPFVAVLRPDADPPPDEHDRARTPRT